MRSAPGAKVAAANAPHDLDALGRGAANMPPRMAEELRSLGLI